MNNSVELWKRHPYIGIIEVSSFGRVRTLNRVVPRNGGICSIKGRVLKQYDNGSGYLRVHFHIDGKWTNKYVHRLVAETFISNPENFPQVNHKDCDRTNNNVKNLEFCTASYNAKYRNEFGISNAETQGQPLFAVNMTTLEVSHFRSQHEASRILGVSRGSIYSVLKGSRNHAGGYLFVNDDGHSVDVVNHKIK